MRPNWVIQPWPKFIIGSLILLAPLSAFILIGGMKRYLLSQKNTASPGGVRHAPAHRRAGDVLEPRFRRHLHQRRSVDGEQSRSLNAIITSAKENGWTTAGSNFWTTVLVELGISLTRRRLLDLDRRRDQVRRALDNWACRRCSSTWSLIITIALAAQVVGVRLCQFLVFGCR